MLVYLGLCWCIWLYVGVFGFMLVYLALCWCICFFGCFWFFYIKLSNFTCNNLLYIFAVFINRCNLSVKMSTYTRDTRQPRPPRDNTRNPNTYQPRPPRDNTRNPNTYQPRPPRDDTRIKYIPSLGYTLVPFTKQNGFAGKYLSHIDTPISEPVYVKTIIAGGKITQEVDLTNFANFLNDWPKSNPTEVVGFLELPYNPDENLSDTLESISEIYFQQWISCLNVRGGFNSEEGIHFKKVLRTLDFAPFDFSVQRKNTDLHIKIRMLLFNTLSVVISIWYEKEKIDPKINAVYIGLLCALYYHFEHNYGLGDQLAEGFDADMLRDYVITDPSNIP